jgi:hypothetical protein
MAEQADDPAPLDEAWPRDELARRLSDLGVDLGSWIEPDAPIEKYRAAYRVVLGRWNDQEAGKANRMQELVAAIAAKPTPPLDAPDTQPPGSERSSIDSIRRHARSAKLWRRAAALLYWTVSGMFVVAASIIALALLKLASPALALPRT